jgi:5-methylcytosine-specific restriction endonuclease McrA
MDLHEQVKKLKSEGKSRKEIGEITKLSKSSIKYYLDDKHREKIKQRTKKHRINSPYTRKIERFKRAKKYNRKKVTYIGSYQQHISKRIYSFMQTNRNEKFTTKDVIDKIGLNPKCYLTGDIIDISKPDTYQFDHIIPVSKGGTNTLDNLNIATRDANNSKYDMLLEDYIKLCKRVLENHGFEVNYKSSESVGSTPSYI